MTVFYLEALAAITISLPVFIFLQNQGFGSIPPVFSIFVAARSRGERYRDDQSPTSMFFPLPPQSGVVA